MSGMGPGKEDAGAELEHPRITQNRKKERERCKRRNRERGEAGHEVSVRPMLHLPSPHACKQMIAASLCDDSNTAGDSTKASPPRLQTSTRFLLFSLLTTSAKEAKRDQKRCAQHLSLLLSPIFLSLLTLFARQKPKTHPSDESLDSFRPFDHSSLPSTSLFLSLSSPLRRLKLRDD